MTVGGKVIPLRSIGMDPLNDESVKDITSVDVSPTDTAQGNFGDVVNRIFKSAAEKGWDAHEVSIAGAMSFFHGKEEDDMRQAEQGLLESFPSTK